MNIPTSSKELSRSELHATVIHWIKAWNNHDLITVMALFDEESVFESWTGGLVRGKKRIRMAWSNWFINHGNFNFEIEQISIDEQSQDVAFTWKLTWINPEKQAEIRYGIDYMHFVNALITLKRSYSQPPAKIKTS